MHYRWYSIFEYKEKRYYYLGMGLSKNSLSGLWENHVIYSEDKEGGVRYTREAVSFFTKFKFIREPEK